MLDMDGIKTTGAFACCKTDLGKNLSSTKTRDRERVVRIKVELHESEGGLHLL